MKQNNLNSLVGKVLVASPNLQGDHFFEKTLVYIFMHNKNGAFGIILNQKIDEISKRQLNDIFYQVYESKIFSRFYIQSHQRKLPIMLGGPVNTCCYITLSISYAKQQIITQYNSSYITLYFNIKNFLKDYIEKNRIHDFLFIKGVSIWEKGRIEEEVVNNDWFVVTPNFKKIFSQQSEHRWDFYIQALGLDKNSLVIPCVTN